MANTSPGRWIYNTQRWRKLRVQILRPGTRCNWNLRGCTRGATTLDHWPIDTHVFPRGDPRAWHPDYVVPACQHCNSTRAARLQARLKKQRRSRTTRRW